MAKEMSDADILNDIEDRVRKGKPVTKREIGLLVESYSAFGVQMPKDILKKIGY